MNYPSGWRGWPREVTDQLLHTGWGAASGGLLSFAMFATTPLAAGVCGGIGMASILAIVVREARQWPPAEDRPWDAYVDWFFFALGIAIGALA